MVVFDGGEVKVVVGGGCDVVGEGDVGVCF